MKTIIFALVVLCVAAGTLSQPFALEEDVKTPVNAEADVEPQRVYYQGM